MVISVKEYLDRRRHNETVSVVDWPHQSLNIVKGCTENFRLVRIAQTLCANSIYCIFMYVCMLNSTCFLFFYQNIKTLVWLKTFRHYLTTECIY